MDKECELQKIAVFESYLNTAINAQYSFLAGGLIGVLILIFTMFVGGVFDVFGGRLFGSIPFAAVLMLVFYANFRFLKGIDGRHKKFNALIFNLIDKVENGEPIPPLEELERKVFFKNKL